ncbi:NAD(P)/FAD-dependent oxidoreductase [Lichenihabitans sp. Uapishka_5]|uniref:NAD(P)/FAD-dependent oxidoreductase n=1 Tax=Lichenihabitans sp. Uapishka_5 TaxID=3037302 RepID=UPI0029E7E5AC|nr:NAD(P)/FAD-dependent oxidoreductase [Lichenihabitans sp. Uapishka_5]MDX7951381.1 NAD(P)/FAD-dependent oxidoreductase [Lichenihabitans sp. Uapishka_5]
MRVVVIGAGVVGCAVVRRLTLDGHQVMLLERAADILAGASKANSALLHTGFDAPPGSLERELMQRGHAEFMAIRERLNLPLLETGAMVAAWTEEELAKLPGIEAQARQNGVDDVALLTRAEALAREPALAPHLMGALLVPREHVIDAWSSPLAYLTQAVANGAEARFGCEVTGGRHDGRHWFVETSTGTVEGDFVVNCAGLFGDRLEAALMGDASFEIRPRKGQFVVYDKPAAKLLTTILLPVPTERTKGVVLARTAYGNLLVGPTAEEQEDRSRATVDQDALGALMAKAVELIPALADVPINATYAGLRPASDKKEYRIRHEPDRGWLTLGGIRSTGLTAALGLAAHAADLLAAREPATPIADPAWTTVPNIAEHRERDWQRSGYGEIVCHCELVTDREIVAAFGSRLPPGDFGGLRRRTRAAMGRCQGFYCGARLAELTRGRLAMPLSIGEAE